MDISFVKLKDGSLLVGKGKKQFFAEPHETLASWYSPDFFLKDPLPWYIHESYEIRQTLDLDDLSSTIPPPCYTSPKPFEEMYHDHCGEKRVVYTSLDCQNFNWRHTADQLVQKMGSFYLYGTQGIMGATPELLFDLEKDKLSTMALAATALDLAELEQIKEQEEQEYVILGIQEALKDFGQLEIGQKTTLAFGKLFHLLTPISLYFREKKRPTFNQLVKALHPTPALGAWPRKEGMLWLEKWEKLIPRKKFGAPFGYSLPEKNEARAFVAIRCVQWEQFEPHAPETHDAKLWAGVGVTAKSEFNKEWQEISHKFKMTAQLMGIEEKL